MYSSLQKILVILFVCAVIGFNIDLLEQTNLSRSVVALLAYEDYDKGTPHAYLYERSTPKSDARDCVEALDKLEDQSGRFREEHTRFYLYISSHCETNEEFLQKFAATIDPESTVETLYLAHALFRKQQQADGIELLKNHPGLSKYFAFRGVGEREVYQDEASALKSFQISLAIDGSLKQEQVNMYRILCIWSVNRADLATPSNSCDLFDEISPSAASKSLLGQQAYAAGQYNLALEYFQASFSLDPNDPFASHYWRGLTLLELEDNTGAIKAFKTGIDYNPNYPENYYVLGQLFTELGDIDQATYYLTTHATLENNTK